MVRLQTISSNRLPTRLGMLSGRPLGGSGAISLGSIRLGSIALGLIIVVSVLLSACSTTSPPPISAHELAEAQTFPYYKVYWVGRDFGKYPLTAADGRADYDSSLGDSVYYGDCLNAGQLLSTSSCVLPLQITTLIYEIHSNADLGPQRNAVLRGVPAAIYDNGTAIELYTGRSAVEIFSNNLPDAVRAADELRPLNGPGSSATPLPPPVFCPELVGKIPSKVRTVLDDLPRHICQATEAAVAAEKKLIQERDATG